MKAPARAPLRREVHRELPHAVRIIGGQWKRSKLPVPDHPGLRPTPSQVRETVFNWLGQDLTGRRCLDAFAGSGAMGFEAASRNAAAVVLLERDRGLAQGLVECKGRLGATSVRIERVDALAWMAACAAGHFDLIFLDPPFDAGLTLPAVGGVVYLESGRPIDAEILAAAGWQITRRAQAGQVHFGLLARSSASPSDKLDP